MTADVLEDEIGGQVTRDGRLTPADSKLVSLCYGLILVHNISPIRPWRP